MAKDPARKWTNKELKEMEQHIGGIYDQALAEITEKWDAYMAKSAKRLDKLHEAYQNAPAEKKEDALKAYQDALRNVTFKDKYYRDMVQETTTRIYYTNKVATAYMNGQMPQIYKVNYDQIDPAAVLPGIKYSMVSEETIANLIKDGTIPQRDLDERKDKTWNTKQIGSTVLQGILQGESIKDISKRLLPIVNKNEASAVRNARTMTTCAENRGRLDRYADYESKGLVMAKVWIATGDDRTRDWHLTLDGQEVSRDENFIDGQGNELMYPGDPDAASETTWNCRCSMRSHILGVRGKNGKITPIEDMHKSGLHQEQIGTERKKRDMKKPEKITAKEKKEEQEPKTAQEKTFDAIKSAYTYHTEHNGLNRVSADELGDTAALYADYGKLSDKTQEEFAGALDGLISQYDTSLTEVRTMTKMEFMAERDAFAYVHHDYTTGSATMVINPTKTRDYDAMISRLQELKENGYIAQIDDEKMGEYVVTHEFAHTFLDMETKLKDKNNFVGEDYDKIKSVRKEITGIYDEYVEKIGKLEEKKNEFELQYLMGGAKDEALADKAIELEDEIAKIKISDYSMVNADELMAEAFAHDRLGGQQNEYVSRIMAIINHNFGRE